jgi:hypothetical protein
MKVNAAVARAKSAPLTIESAGMASALVKTTLTPFRRRDTIVQAS